MTQDTAADVIIIGGGIAGLSAAYMLAKEGKSVILMERGETCGSKNMTGGRIYIHSLKQLLGTSAVAQAPLERLIVKERMSIMSTTGTTMVEYTDVHATEEDFQSYSILRSVFDAWLADKIEELGGMILTGVQVEQLVEQDGRIAGVQISGEEILADTVIAADGIHSFIAQQAGLKNDLDTDSVGLGVKEIIQLSEEKINERFSLRQGEGTAHLFLGVTQGLSGGGFIYTNRSSISLGIVVDPQELAGQEKTIYELLQEFKTRDAVFPLIQQGKTVEYSAHLVNEAGLMSVPRTLCREGLLVIGDAAGFVINMGTTIRGMDLAVWSGINAAKAILTASSAREINEMYMKYTNETIIPVMERYKRYPKLLKNPRLFKEYPTAANDMMHAVFSVDSSMVPAESIKEAWKIAKKSIGIKHLALDSWEVLRSL